MASKIVFIFLLVLSLSLSIQSTSTVSLPPTPHCKTNTNVSKIDLLILFNVKIYSCWLFISSDPTYSQILSYFEKYYLFIIDKYTYTLIKGNQTLIFLLKINHFIVKLARGATITDGCVNIIDLLFLHIVMCLFYTSNVVFL